MAGIVDEVHAFDVLGDPVRRRILELLADGERSAGAVTEVVRGEFGISQPAVSQHLKVLRENGSATDRCLAGPVPAFLGPAP
jgi:DNA-binding transcriptional ArsR family regulator